MDSIITNTPDAPWFTVPQQYEDTLAQPVVVQPEEPVPSGRAARKPVDAKQTAVRRWAREQGIAVGQRGRVPAELIARYDLAHKDGQ